MREYYTIDNYSKLFGSNNTTEHFLKGLASTIGSAGTIKTATNVATGSLNTAITAATTTAIRNLDDVVANTVKNVDTIATTALRNTDTIATTALRNTDEIATTALKNTDTLATAAVKNADTVATAAVKNADTVATAAAKSSDEIATAAAKNADTVATATAKNTDEVANLAETTAKSDALKAGKSLDEATNAGKLAKAKVFAKYAGVAALGAVGVYFGTVYFYGKFKQEEKEKEYKEQRESAKDAYQKLADCKASGKSEEQCLQEDPKLKEDLDKIQAEQPEWWDCYKKCADGAKGKTPEQIKTICSNNCQSKEKHAGFQCPPFSPQFLCDGMSGLSNLWAGLANVGRIILVVVAVLIVLGIVIGLIKLFK